MPPDAELLRRYAENHDQAAFAELVRRHVDWLYAAVLRLVGRDTHAAEDVTQTAFAVLAREAGRLVQHVTIAGWLHTTAFHAAAKHVRTEQRRRAREQEASLMHHQPSSEIDWASVQPVLDAAVQELRGRDRDAIILRYFQGLSHRKVGDHLGVSENAARMRVERALEDLRDSLARRGLATSGALLSTTLGAHGITAAPAGFAAGLAGKVLAAGSVGAPPATPAAWFKALSMRTKLLTASGTAVAALLLGFFLLHGQTPAPSPPPAVKAEVASAPPTPVVDEPPVPPAPAVSLDTLARANNQFAIDLYKQLGAPANTNTFFSPYSISTALAMTLVGARGETATQMANVLHLSQVAAGALAPSFGAMQKALAMTLVGTQGETATQMAQLLHLSQVATGALAPSYGAMQKALADAQAKSGANLTVANSLWPEVNPEHPFKPAFIDVVQNNFDTMVFPTDFKTNAAAAVGRINEWVAQKTQDKIKNVIGPADVDAATRLILVNTLYFKGQWASPFNEFASAPGDFHLADGSTQPVTLMHQTIPALGGSARYAEVMDGTASLQILSLNYFSGDPNPAPAGRGFGRGRGGPQTGALSMVIVLPRDAAGLKAMEKDLTADKLAGWLGQLAPTTVEVFLPRFKVEDRYELKEALKALGMANAFKVFSPGAANQTADFSGMNGTRELYVSKVIHQTFVDVDEKGTEAAAATAVELLLGGNLSSVLPSPPPVFRADHPFLFLIRDDATGSILFLGRLAHP